MDTVKSDQASLESAIQSLQMRVAELNISLKKLGGLCNCIDETNRLLLQLIQAMPSKEDKNQRTYARSTPPQGALRDPKVQTVIIDLRKSGHTYEEIVKEIHRKWPDDPGRNTSKSAIHRFCNKARGGHYAEFGIAGW